MTDTERKQLIADALHGARVGVEKAPTPKAPAVAPCCNHCIHKMGLPPTVQPAPYYPYIDPTIQPYITSGSAAVPTWGYSSGYSNLLAGASNVLITS